MMQRIIFRKSCFIKEKGYSHGKIPCAKLGMAAAGRIVSRLA